MTFIHILCEVDICRNYHLNKTVFCISCMYIYRVYVYPITHVRLHAYIALQFDADRNGHITVAEIGEVFKALGESVPGYKIRDMVKEVDIDENGTVEFNEFCEVSIIWKCM